MQKKGNEIAPIKQRIFEYIENKGIKKTEFYDNTKLNASNFKTSALKSELGSDKVRRILTVYPDINPQWLITGEGNMTKLECRLKLKEIREAKGLSINEISKRLNIDATTYVKIEENKKQLPAYRLLDVALALDANVNDLIEINSTLKNSSLNLNLNFTRKKEIIHTGPTGNKYTEMGNGKFKVSVPLVGARAYARYLSDFQDDEDLKDRYDYVDFVVDMIGKGRYYAFEIKGDSMDDDSKRSIPDRSTVLARDVMQDHWKNKLNFKKYPFWIIVHQGSILCKEIIDHDVEKGIIKCHSINPSPEYTDFEIDLSEVKQLLNIVKVQQDVNYY